MKRTVVLIKGVFLVMMIVLISFLYACDNDDSQNGSIPNNNDNTNTEYYTVSWLDYNGNTLQSNRVKEGSSVPVFSGSTPYKPDDDDFEYVFSGWTPNKS